MRLGEEKKERKIERMKIYMVSLFHRATIKETTGQKYNGLPYSIGWP